MSTQSETSRNVDTLVLVIATVMLSLAAYVFITGAYDNQKRDNAANDRCWVQGGEYKDGKCVLPEPDPYEAVCESYYIVSGEEIVHCLNKGVWTEVPKLSKN